jgi:signal transduction histidine kinase
MLNRRTELDFNRLVRIAAWIWLGNLLALAGIDAFILVGDPQNRPWAYYLGNAFVALAFLGLSRWSTLAKRLGNGYAPLMLMILTGLPILVGHLLLPTLPALPLFNIEGITLRLLPILFIGLVITAWLYHWKEVVGFVLGTAGLQIALFFVFPPPDSAATQAALFVTLVRSVSFLVVGYFISQLMQQIRFQQDELAQKNARLTDYADTLERLTISRERNRLARELHDTLAHTLSGLSVQLETTKAYLDVDPETTRKLLAQALSVTRDGLDETRRALKALRARPLDDLGLIQALRQLSESAADRGKLDLELILPERVVLSPSVEQNIYRIAQEAIENVVLHANAQHLLVRLVVNPNNLILSVQDNGLGLALTEESGHFGLSGIRERAQLLGAELTVESQIGRGTMVQLRM